MLAGIVVALKGLRIGGLEILPARRLHGDCSIVLTRAKALVVGALAVGVHCRRVLGGGGNRGRSDDTACGRQFGR